MAPTNTFTITAVPGTDIWRKPPATDVFNGNYISHDPFLTLRW